MFQTTKIRVDFATKMQIRRGTGGLQKYLVQLEPKDPTTQPRCNEHNILYCHITASNKQSPQLSSNKRPQSLDVKCLGSAGTAIRRKASVARTYEH